MADTALVHFNHSEKENLTSWPDMRTAAWRPNYGDMLVCAAIIRELDLGATDRVGFGYDLKTKVNRAIVRGSTYIHRNFNFHEANQTLDSIDAPLAIVGLGAQNPTLDLDFVDDLDGAREFIARLNEKSESISVRGEFSAAVVEKLGGENIRITGCPSLFYLGDCPRVDVPEMLSRPERRLGISLHTGLMRNIFCADPVSARRMHAVCIDHAVNNASSVSLFEQGVLTEYNVADRRLPFDERLESAEKILAQIQGDDLMSAYDLIARMVSVRSIEEWLSKARDLDAIIGFRFHGNMVALLQGSPCFYYTYDSRLKEFCEIYNLPSRDVADEWEDPIDVMLDHDWDETNARFETCYTELKAFYAENGFVSRLA